MINLLNSGKRVYIHQITDANGDVVTYRIGPNETKDIPEDVAKLWLRSPEIRQVGASDDTKDKEIERLKKELAKAKKAVDKPVNKPVDKTEDDSEISYLTSLKAEAKALKIKGYATMKKETLIAKIVKAKQLDIEQ